MKSYFLAVAVVGLLQLEVSHGLAVEKNRRQYFGDVMTGGALMAGAATIAPAPAHADAAKVRNWDVNSMAQMLFRSYYNKRLS